NHNGVSINDSNFPRRPREFCVNEFGGTVTWVRNHLGNSGALTDAEHQQAKKNPELTGLGAFRGGRGFRSPHSVSSCCIRKTFRAVLRIGSCGLGSANDAPCQDSLVPTEGRVRPLRDARTLPPCACTRGLACSNFPAW